MFLEAEKRNRRCPSWRRVGRRIVVDPVHRCYPTGPTEGSSIEPWRSPSLSLPVRRNPAAASFSLLGPEGPLPTHWKELLGKELLHSGNTSTGSRVHGQFRRAEL